MPNFDIAIIGSGPAGYTAALRARHYGKSVCLIEQSRERLGGVCLHEGCIPLKSFIQSAALYHAAQYAEDFGVALATTGVRMENVVACAQKTMQTLHAGLLYALEKQGVEIIYGKARFASPTDIVVQAVSEEISISCAKVLIATGSRPRMISGFPCDDECIMTSTQALTLQKLPGSIMIIGAGAIGCEFASFFRTLGVDVTVVEAMDAILPLEDAELARTLTREFKKKGIEMICGAQAHFSGVDDDKVIIEIRQGDSSDMRHVERVLIAIGRQPNTEALGLENVGVSCEKGFIQVDETMRTSCETISAAGDVVATPMLAHMATAEGKHAVDAMVGEKASPLPYHAVPNVVYTKPEVASIGLTEQAAQDNDCEVQISKHFFKANGKAVLMHQDAGLVKLVADKQTGALLGAHIIGPEAGELIHECALALSAGLAITDIQATIHAHPTLSEIILDTAENFL